MDMWIWPQNTQYGLTWPEEGSVASDDPPVIKELFMQLERSPPLASHWASTQDPPNYWGQRSGQQPAFMTSSLRS